MENAFQLRFEPPEQILKFGLSTSPIVQNTTKQKSLGIVSGMTVNNGILPNTIPVDIQIRRDEVRRMVKERRPAEGIPLYRGLRGGDGSATTFLKQHYMRYLPGHANGTLFMHDLRKIDPQLARAINTERTTPLGTKSDLIRALVQGLFTDGEDTRIRVYQAVRRSWKASKR